MRGVAAFKNLARAALLTCMATFLGCFLLFTLPDAAATMLTGRPLPVWFYQKEVRRRPRAAPPPPPPPPTFLHVSPVLSLLSVIFGLDSYVRSHGP